MSDNLREVLKNLGSGTARNFKYIDLFQKLPPDAIENLVKVSRILTQSQNEADQLRILQELTTIPETARCIHAFVKFLENYTYASQPSLSAPDLLHLLRLIAAGPFPAHLLNRFANRAFEFCKEANPAAVTATFFEDKWKDFKETTQISEASALSGPDLLRDFQSREILRIAFLEVNEILNIDLTSRQIAFLAEVISQKALEMSYERSLLSKPQKPAVTFPLNDYFLLGMGKLGGLELNFSSDIDVIPFYRKDSNAAAAAVEAGPHEFYSRLTEIWVKSLSEVTPFGFAYRVDLRLRPEGSRGPLVNSISSAQQYYETWGNLWDRAAYLKARPLAGNKRLALTFLRALEPFIFRRHLDFKVLDEMKKMKRKIHDDLQARHKESDDNIKLGWGGIREIEFFVQTLQLIHGGKETHLRSGNTLTVLKNLLQTNILPENDVEDLSQAYLFLRRVEHLLQIYENQQTHSLPGSGEKLAQLAYLMSYTSTPLFLESLKQHRSRVHDLFESLLKEGDFKEKSLGSSQVGENLFLLLVQSYPSQASPSTDAQDKTAWIEPEVLTLFREIAEIFESEIKAHPDWRQFMHGLERLFRQIGLHLEYYQEWRQVPATVSRLLEILARSDFLTELMIQQIGLLRLLAQTATPTEPESFVPLLKQRLAAAKLQPGFDRGDAMDLLRRFRNEIMFEIGVRDLFAKLPLHETQNLLTALADACIQIAAEWVLEELGQRYTEGKPASASCAILALGSLGAGELNYTSDLDLVFIYDESSKAGVPGVAPHHLGYQEFFTLFAQRLISFLNAHTPAGIAYRIDTRLRPSGRAGMLVTSQQGFVEYHLRKSQLWEVQSLLRSRPVFAASEMQKQIQMALRSATFKPFDISSLREELHRMRLRVERERSHPIDVKTQTIDLKLGRGGMLDIEFICQFLQLAHGGPSQPHTLKALQELVKNGHLSLAQLNILSAAYERFRYLLSRLCLLSNQNIETLHPGLPRLDEIARTLAFDDAVSLIDSLRQQADQVRKIYLNILGVSE